MERFNLEKAQEEAVQMAAKIETGQAKGYPEAEKQVEEEEVKNSFKGPGKLESPDFSTLNYYERLGIASHATNEEIRTAYRKLAQEHHPDKGGETKKFQYISEAYEALRDKEKRQLYDIQHDFVDKNPLEDSISSSDLQKGYGEYQMEGRFREAMSQIISNSLREAGINLEKIDGEISAQLQPTLSILIGIRFHEYSYRWRKEVFSKEFIENISEQIRTVYSSMFKVDISRLKISPMYSESHFDYDNILFKRYRWGKQDIKIVSESKEKR